MAGTDVRALDVRGVRPEGAGQPEGLTFQRSHVLAGRCVVRDVPPERLYGRLDTPRLSGKISSEEVQI